MKTARFPSPALVPCCLALLGALSSCGGGNGGEKSGASAGKSAAGEKLAKGAAKGADKAGEKQKGGSSAALAHQIGLQHLEKGDLAKAEAEFQRALEIDPKMSEAHFELGRIKLQQAMQKSQTQSIDLELLGQCIAALSTAVEIEPENDQYHLHLGRAYFQKDDLDQALAHLGKSVELNPELVAGWKALGSAQLDSDKPESARDSFKRAIEVQPMDPGAHYNLAQALEVLGDLAGARAELEKSLELDRTVYEVHGRLAQLCSKLGDAEGEAKGREGMQRWFEHDQRLQRCRKAMKANPADAAAVRRMGELYYDVGEWPRAIEYFVRAVKMDRRDWRAHLQCGVACRHVKDYTYATHFLKEAEFLAPDVLDPKLELVRLYAEREDDVSLTALVTKFEEEASADGDSLYFMAEVCQEVGRKEHAARLFEKAKALGVTETPQSPAMVEDEEQAGGGGPAAAKKKE